MIHDENSNGKLDTNFMRIPVEPYAFTNNAHANFGPPKYDKVKFDFVPDEVIIKIIF